MVSWIGTGVTTLWLAGPESFLWLAEAGLRGEAVVEREPVPDNTGVLKPDLLTVKAIQNMWFRKMLIPKLKKLVLNLIKHCKLRLFLSTM